MDGNVYRVLARYYGIDEPINSPKGKKTFQQLADELLDHNHPAAYNQAIMEFGAILCKPKNPACGICPVRLNCYAFKHNATTTLPVKLKKTKTRTRYFNYLLIFDDDRILMHKRGLGDIWANMYELPLIETQTLITPEEALSQCKESYLPSKYAIRTVSNIHKHVLTHQHLYVRFITLDRVPETLPDDYFFTEVKKLKKMALPQIIFIFLTNFLN